MAKKRERLEVINDVLLAVMASGSNIRPTRLLYASNLSPQMFKEYIGELLEKEFIESIFDKKGKKTYTLTKKGYEFIEKYKKIVQFIENFGL